MTGVDIPIPECQLILHQPSITEISYLGQTDFFIGVQTLCLYKSMFIEDKDVLDRTSNFQIFMTIMKDKQTLDKKRSVLQVFTLIFPKYKVLMTPQSLLFQEEKESHVVDENNFDAFQSVLRQVFCSQEGPMDQQAFNPANSKAKEIADKLMRGRQRVAAQKSDSNSNVFSIYLSVLTIGLHISLLELEKLTMFQLYDLIERYFLYINWDLDIQTRLAGGKPDHQPESWTKGLH
jgi:hypothetical protein